LDLFGVCDSYGTSDSAEEADAKATFSDWAMVGQDLLWAMDEFDRMCPAGEVAAQTESTVAVPQISSSR
jgi:hypothetical protein